MSVIALLEIHDSQCAKRRNEHHHQPGAGLDDLSIGHTFYAKTNSQCIYKLLEGDIMYKFEVWLTSAKV